MNFRNFGKTVSFSKHPVFYYLYLAPVKAYSEIGKMRPPTLDMNRKLNLVCAWVISKFWNFGVIIFRCKIEFAKSKKKVFLVHFSKFRMLYNRLVSFVTGLAVSIFLSGRLCPISDLN